MNPKSIYKTKQRNMIIEYFQKSDKEHICAGEICEYFKSQGSEIGKSTIYRQLEKLVDEGILNKHVVDNSTSACFEYVGSDGHVHEGNCYHCICEKCGKLFHMHCGTIEGIEKHMLINHNFQIDPNRTIFYGTCEHCR